MSTLKMTFSLASLIFLIALIAATPVMAAEVFSDGISGTLSAAGTTPEAGTPSSFGVISHADDASAAPTGSANFTVNAVLDGNVDLTNLAEAFRVGTTIVLLAPALTQRDGTTTITATTDAVMTKDVVISEIMWGLNSNAATFAEEDDQQWIELYNTTDASVNMGAWILYIVDDPGDIPAPAEIDVDHDNDADTDAIKVMNGVSLEVPTAGTAVQYVLVDVVSNQAGGYWKGTGWVNDIGQSGTLPRDTTTVTPVPLISMYRNINHTNVLKGDHDADPAKNRTAQLNAVPSGTAKDSWKASQRRFDSHRQGSPGKAEPAGSIAPLTASTVNFSKVIINEIGNSSQNKYDWLELRNTSGADIVIENYQLSNVVGTTKEDNSLIIFPKITIPKDDVLLVVNTDPKLDNDHPIAGGVNVIDEEGTNAGNLIKKGAKSRYYVNDKLVIPNEKVLLILRSVKDKLGTDATGLGALVDVTGTAFITDAANTLATDVWPLVKGTKAVNADGNPTVIKGSEMFGDGTVHIRAKADKSTNDAEIWVVPNAAQSGIGYKRTHADALGTPGYVNGVAQEFAGKATKDDGTANADYKAAPVTISEIMYATGRNLPQWVELYNSSMTQAVNLKGWQLKLENMDDAPIRTMVTVKFADKDKIIPPNQTVLIISTTGTPSDRDHFPNERLINLWRDGLADKTKLEIDEGVNQRSFRFLSQTAFKITLMNKDGEMVDEAGNLGADGTAMWELPAFGAKDARSSIIRRYGDSVKGVEGQFDAARDGTLPIWSGEGSLEAATGMAGMEGDAGWILASETIFALTSGSSYYGHEDDTGTPGYRVGGPLPVSLSKFRPVRLESGEIVIRWITESELNNAGFNILRSKTRSGEFTKVNTSLIAGQGTTSERTTYEWKDTSAKPNVVYYYQIQDVSLDGKVTTLRQTRLKGDVSPAGKLTTTWGELKALQ